LGRHVEVSHLLKGVEPPTPDSDLFDKYCPGWFLQQSSTLALRYFYELHELHIKTSTLKHRNFEFSFLVVLYHIPVIPLISPNSLYCNYTVYTA